MDTRHFIGINTTAPPAVLLGNLVDTECLAFSFFVFVLLCGKVHVAKFEGENLHLPFYLIYMVSILIQKLIRCKVNRDIHV